MRAPNHTTRICMHGTLVEIGIYPIGKIARRRHDRVHLNEQTHGLACEGIGIHKMLADEKRTLNMYNEAAQEANQTEKGRHKRGK